MFLVICQFDHRGLYENLPFLPAAIHGRFRLLSYETLRCLDSVPVGPLIFTDFEGLKDQYVEDAALLIARLQAEAPCVPVLNHPVRSLRRYELLRTLYERGVNSFNVYRLADIEPTVRFPVFVREEHTHGGILTPLIHDMATLRSVSDTFAAQGRSRDDKIVVEFCDYADAGVYRLYSAFKVANEIIPAMVIHARDWELRVFDPATETEEQRAVQADYLATNPHAEQLARIFEIARIDYGRIDYAVVDGRIAVFEINSNPTWPPNHAREAFVKALFALDVASTGATVRLRPHAWRRIFWIVHRQGFQWMEWLIYRTGLWRFPALLSGCYQTQKRSRGWLQRSAERLARLSSRTAQRTN